MIQGYFFTQQQLDQIAKLLPSLINQQNGKATDTDDDDEWKDNMTLLLQHFPGF